MQVLAWICSGVLEVKTSNSMVVVKAALSPTQEPPPSPSWQLTRTMVWVLPGGNSDHGLSFLFSTDLQYFWILAVQILRGLSFGLSFLILWGWGWFPHRQHCGKIEIFADFSMSIWISSQVLPPDSSPHLCEEKGCAQKKSSRKSQADSSELDGTQSTVTVIRGLWIWFSLQLQLPSYWKTYPWGRFKNFA